MNELTIEEFDALSPDTYVLYDIRSTEEINPWCHQGSYRQFRGRTGRKSAGRERQKKLIICCSRGRVSRDVAENLCEQGY